MTTVMVTHDATEALMMSDHVVYLLDGRVVQDDAPADLYEHPATADVAACFGDGCTLQGTVTDGVFRLEGLELPVVCPDGPADLVIRRRAVSLDDVHPTITLKAHCSVYHGDGFLLRFHLEDQVFEMLADRPFGDGDVVGLCIDPTGIFAYPR